MTLATPALSSLFLSFLLPIHASSNDSRLPRQSQSFVPWKKALSISFPPLHSGDKQQLNKSIDCYSNFETRRLFLLLFATRNRITSFQSFLWYMLWQNPRVYIVPPPSFIRRQTANQSIDQLFGGSRIERQPPTGAESWGFESLPDAMIQCRLLPHSFCCMFGQATLLL